MSSNFLSFFKSKKQEDDDVVQHQHQHQEQNKKTAKKNPCCDCPETKHARDKCMFDNGDEEACRWVIEAHNLCMEYTTRETLLQRIKDSGAEDRVPTKKVCCSCPVSKRYRDDCVVEHGTEKCEWLIEGHKMCLRNEGFKIVCQ